VPTKVQIERCEIAAAPKPLGNYSHAVAYGDLVFVSGMASRDFRTNQVPGLKLDASGNRTSYDITAETVATLENLKCVLEGSGSDLEHVLEVNVFLTDMKDFEAYNKVFAQYFPAHRPARTTLGVASLPGKIAIEMKAVAVKR
jgi:2-aminomuconate deaminase